MSPRHSKPRCWTPEQLAAIRTVGRSLLVSAAAGSGKTSVLAERCAHLVSDATPRCNVSQLLVVTFTEAAAAGMKARIEEALRNRLHAAPDDPHLRRQLALLDHAHISTLHSFCHRILRQHFHRLGLDPAFRVLDADEASLMRLEVVRELFMDCYDADDAHAFHRFIDAFGEGDDEGLCGLVIRIHELLQSLVDPERWRRAAAQRIAEAIDRPLEQSELGREYLSIVRSRLDDLQRDCRLAIQSIRPMDGFASYLDYLEAVTATLERWAALLQRQGYDALVAAVRIYELDDLPRMSNAAPGKQIAHARISAVKDQLAKGAFIESLRFTTQEWQAGLRAIQPHADVLLDLIRRFDIRYRKAKDAARALDFADLERFALRLLLDCPAPPLRPSPVARMFHKQFHHVLVDEYQDINEVQDAILTLLSRECLCDSSFDGSSAAPAALADDRPSANLFCVGDVKQSIYRFRLAEPARFLERHENFKRSGSFGQVIDLQANFRSRKPLIDILNEIFKRLMIRDAAEIEYDDSHRLHAAAEFRTADCPAFAGAPIELHYLPARLEARTPGAGEAPDEAESPEVDLERSGREALLIARRIEELMGGQSAPRMHIFDRDAGYRPIEYRDIVILLRATRYHADEYADVLRTRDIPVHNAGGGGYFDAMEVRDMLSLLRLLDNQRQDIPMAAVLRSPLSGLPEPEDALARIRLAYPYSDRARDAPPLPFHEAVVRYAAEKDDELAAKLRDFFNDLGHWRQIARQRPVAELLWAIYERTGFLAFCNGLENGQQRCANLIHLYERARQFSAFSRQSLYRFIRFLESLDQESDAAQASELSEADNVVRIMSIHKAKGLEFPVVFIPELGKKINMQDCAGNVLADRHACLGLTAVDEERRIRYPSLAGLLVSDRLKRQTLAEELRVLYVATTRAKEHLILVGTAADTAIEAWHRTYDRHEGHLPPSAILSARTMLDWLGPVAAALSADGGRSMQIYPHPAEEVREWLAAHRPPPRPEQSIRLARLEPLTPPPDDNPLTRDIIARLQYTYPHSDFTRLEASRSVTAWTKSAHASPPAPTAHIAHSSFPDSTLALPRCLLDVQASSGAERGTAVHLFLEHLDFSRPCSDGDLRHQLDLLVDRRLITPAQRALTDLSTIRWFLDTELGGLLRDRAGHLLRELPVNYALSPDRIIPTPSDDPLDRVMLRGRIDLLVPDDHGFVLIDYKTDQLAPADIPQRAQLYAPQIDLYRDAIKKITSRPIHAAYLIFLSARQIICC